MRYSDYLEHHGVKGMHWGIRRYQPYSQTGGRKSGKSGKEIGKAAKKAGRTAAKLASPTGYAVYKGSKAAKERRYNNSDYAKAKKMSDQELRDRINRINLEQNYVQAMQRDRDARKAAGQSVLYKHGHEALKYGANLPKDKKFKARVAKKAAVAIGL